MASPLKNDQNWTRALETVRGVFVSTRIVRTPQDSKVRSWVEDGSEERSGGSGRLAQPHGE